MNICDQHLCIQNLSIILCGVQYFFSCEILKLDFILKFQKIFIKLYMDYCSCFLSQYRTYGIKMSCANGTQVFAPISLRNLLAVNVWVVTIQFT